MKEIKSLTGIRGIAALWVVMLHFVYVPDFKTDSIFLDALNQFLKKGNMGVDMFFMLSAFVMSLAYQHVFDREFSFKEIKVYLLKRFIRIYPAYVFWLLVAALLYKKWSLGVIGMNLLLSQNFFDPDIYVIASVFWSLCAEWWMYMIFPFVYFLLCKLNSNTYIYMVLLIVISFVGLYMLPTLNTFYIDNNGIAVKEYDHQFSVIVGINSIVRSLFSYLIGIAIFLITRDQYKMLDKFLSPKSIYIISGIILSLSLFRNTEIGIIMCFALLIIALYLNKESENFFSSRIIYFLGLISYSIYLIHTTLRFIVTVIAMKVFHIPIETADLPCMLVASVLLIPISYLSYTYIEMRTGGWLKAKFVQ